MSRRLRIARQGEPPRLVETIRDQVYLGRTPSNDIILPDGGAVVSRQHALISFHADGSAIVQDLNSANGTFLNDVRIKGPTAMSGVDMLRIGPYQIALDGLPSGEVAQPQTDAGIAGFAVEPMDVDLENLQKKVQLVDPADALRASVELGHLELLHEVGVRLARTTTVAEVTQCAIELLFRIDGVNRATLLLWNEDRGELHGSDLYDRKGKRQFGESGPEAFDARRIVLSRTILDRVRKLNQPVHVRDTSRDETLRTARSIIAAGIRAAFCAPLTFQGRFLGVLYADNLRLPNAFSPTDFRTFSTIAAQTGLALAHSLAREELMEREVERAALRRYLPAQVVEMIESEGGTHLGGVLQPVAVLFADIRGFTKLSEQMDARDVVQLLNELFTAVTAEVMEAGGVLDKFIGDCVMALFGAPISASDDVPRTLRAAANIQRAAAKLSASRRERGLEGIDVGVGVHHGMAVVGNIGSAQRMQYTAIGDTVNVAARLVGQAAGGEIIVSEAVRSAAGPDFAFESRGMVELKGRSEKIGIEALQWC